MNVIRKACAQFPGLVRRSVTPFPREPRAPLDARVPRRVAPRGLQRRAVGRGGAGVRGFARRDPGCQSERYRRRSARLPARRYADLQNADPDRWRLLTGERDSIYALARRSYLVAREAQAEAQEHGMIHTENFVLIDRQGRIRGFYDGTSGESVQLLAQHARQLLGSK